MLWYGTIVVTSVLIGVKYYQSNTHILMEIYKDERLISKVRRVSCVIAGVLFVAAPIAILFGVFGVLNKLSMMNAQ